MAPNRVFRVIEGAFVTLFFLQASRVVFSILLSMLSAALAAHRFSIPTVSAQLILLGMFVLPWFSPRSRTRLPQVLMLTAVGVAVARLGLSVQPESIRLYSGLSILGLAGVYFTSLVRANWRAWISSLVVGLALEQLLRARDTYDLLLRMVTDVPIGELRLRMPVFMIQVIIALILFAISIRARRAARKEPYEPAHLTVLGGLAFGSFLALQIIVLGTPNVVARWAGVPYSALVAWLLLATALPLMPSTRILMGETLGIFDDRLRGWVWLFLLLLMLVVGNRLAGFGAAGALIVAQFMSVMLLWWIPSPQDPHEAEQVGPSISLGLFAFAALVFIYSLIFFNIDSLAFVKGQALAILLAAGALLGMPRLFWREEDPWLHKVILPKGLVAAFAAPVAIFGLILSGIPPQRVVVPLGETIRVASYNINGGFDEQGRFQLDLIAKTIEASLADIVVLQEVDTGGPMAYGIDEAEYLGRRLAMYHAYYPTAEHLYGVAILSRWPLSDAGGALFPSAEEQTGAVTVRISDVATGRMISVIGTQFEVGDQEMRKQQLAALFQMVDQTAPTVLAADLRSGPDDLIYQTLTGGSFIDPDLVLGIEEGYTTPASEPTVRHDYILLRGLVPLDVRQVDRAASDHRLVVVQLTWP